jgi:hypothetical protein
VNLQNQSNTKKLPFLVVHFDSIPQYLTFLPNTLKVTNTEYKKPLPVISIKHLANGRITFRRFLPSKTFTLCNDRERKKAFRVGKVKKEKRKKEKEKKKKKKEKKRKKENRVKTTSSGKRIYKHRSIGRKIFAINF